MAMTNYLDPYAEYERPTIIPKKKEIKRKPAQMMFVNDP